MTDETFTRGPRGVIVPRVPAVLLANLVGDIDDAEGIEIATFFDDRYTWQWQWFRVKDDVETPIRGAVAFGVPASGYTLTPADVGSKIRARMRFRDDAYNQEEWVSPLTPTILSAAPCRAPNLEGGRTLLGSERIELLPLDEGGEMRFGRDPASFTLRGYGVSAVYHATAGSDVGKLVFKLASPVDDTDQRQLALHVCDEVYPLYEDDDPSSRPQQFPPTDEFRWPIGSTGWSELVTRTIHLSRDTAPPRLASIDFSAPPRNDSGPSLFIAFDERLGDPGPLVGDFTVEVDGLAVQLLIGGEFRTEPEGIHLTLAEPLPAAYSSLTVAYTQAANHFVIQDPPGNRTPDFKESVPYIGIGDRRPRRPRRPPTTRPRPSTTRPRRPRTRRSPSPSSTTTATPKATP